MTSSTASPFIPARSNAASMAFPPRSEAENGVNPPPNLPNGVLAPDTMTVFLMLKHPLFSLIVLLTTMIWQRLLYLIERSLNRSEERRVGKGVRTHGVG